VGMRERGGGPGFLQEPAGAFGIERVVRRQDLQGDLAVEPAVPSEIHLAHAPRAERRLDDVGSEASPDGEWHRPVVTASLLARRSPLYVAALRRPAAREATHPT